MALSLYLPGGDAERRHQAVTEDFLVESASRHGGHSEEGDALSGQEDADTVGVGHRRTVLVLGLGRGGTEFLDVGSDTSAHVGSAVEVGHHHQTFDVLVEQKGLKTFLEEVVEGGNPFYGARGHGEFRYVVLEGFPVELAGKISGSEIAELLHFAGMDENGLHLVLPLAETAVQGYAVEPPGQIGLGKTSAKHGFEIDGEVEGYAVEVFCINQYYVWAHYKCFDIMVEGSENVLPNPPVNDVRGVLLISLVNLPPSHLGQSNKFDGTRFGVG